MQAQSNKLNFEEQKIFAGIDVHKKEWKVSIRSAELTYKTIHYHDRIIAKLT